MPSKAKPFYFRGEHALWSDTIGVTPLLQSMTVMYRYDGLLVGLETLKHYADARRNYENTLGLYNFLNLVQTKFDLSAKVADMFTRPGGVVLH